jgi:hypothetical protein
LDNGKGLDAFQRNREENRQGCKGNTVLNSNAVGVHSSESGAGDH